MPSDNLASYYKYVAPVSPQYPPSSFQLEAFEYRGFLIKRVDNPDHLHWQIRTKENGLPPLELRSSFTGKQRAMACLDDWWKREDKLKELAEAANAQ